MTTSPTPEPFAPVAQTPIARRTVLAGAAWSVPAIALTTGSPAFAASGALSLAFSRPAYKGATCSVIQGVRIDASESGTTKAGVSVTASLSDGYVFANGGTTFTDVTGSNGSITLPDISVPASGGTSTVSATASGANSTSSSLGSVEPSTPVYVKNGTRQSSSGIPSGSKPVGGSLYVSPSGDLLDAADGGRVLSRDVAVCGEIASTSGAWSIPVLKADGSCVWVFNGNERGTVNVPNGSSPSAGSSFITSDGREIRGDDGTVRLTGVKSHGTYFGGSQSTMAFALQDGSFVYLESNTVKTAVGIPAGSAPACGRFFLSPAGVLIDGADGSTVASNIASYGVLSIDNSSWLLTARKKTGAAVVVRPGSEVFAAGVPNGSIPIGAGVFLASDGRLIDGLNAGAVLATGVSTPGAFAVLPDSWRIPLAAAATSASTITNGTTQAVSGMPSGSTPAVGTLYLTPGGDLVDAANNWSVVSSNIVAFGQSAADRQNWAVPARKADGTAIYVFNGREYSTTGVPSGSTPNTGSSFIAPDGREISGNDGTVRLTGVAVAGGVYFDGTDYFLPFVKTDGSFVFLRNNTAVTAVGVPSGSAPVAARLFLTPDGGLIEGSNGSVIASSVASFGRIATRNGAWVLPVVKTDGSASTVSSSGEVAASGVPSGSTPVAAGLFRTPGGSIVDGLNGGSTLASDAVLVGTYRELYSSSWTLALGIKSNGC